MKKEYILLMIESLEELADELSLNNHGTLLTEQFELLAYLKTLI